MTKAKIIAELRRSAREDARPSSSLAQEAWLKAIDWKRGDDWAFGATFPGTQRTYCLLVAHALEDE